MADWIFWTVAAAAVFIAELFLGSVYLLLLAAALAGAAVAATFGAKWSLSLLIAAVLSTVSMICLYRKKANQTATNLPDDDLDIGHIVILQTRMPNGNWQVSYRGAPWQAQLNSSASIGEQAVIIGKTGNVLLLKKLPE